MLDSKRLILRKLALEHFDFFCEMDMDPEVMKFYTSRPHGTREYAQRSFNKYEHYMKQYPHLGGFIAFSKETEEFIGLGALIHLELNPQNQDYEVGYRLPKRNWGQGYATEIAQTLIKYGFHNLGLTEIFGTTNPKNVVSEQVLMKCGLKKIGTTPCYGGSNLFKIIK